MQFRPGVILKIGYSGVIYGKTRGGRFKTKTQRQQITKIHDLNPVIFVMWWDTKEKLVHGLNLKYFDRKAMIDFFNLILGKEFKQIDYFGKLGDTRQIHIDDAEEFYHREIKPFLKKHNLNVYRTYSQWKIRGVELFTLRKALRFLKFPIKYIPKY